MMTSTTTSEIPPSRIVRFKAHDRLRLALYSHDTMGLGHVRRNLLIAQSLVHSPLNPVILMLTGAHEANHFSMPEDVDCLTLPSLQKEKNGQYRARHLDISLQDLIKLRSHTIGAALDAFQPDIVLVDNVPRGAVKELDPVLKNFRGRARTRFILGLRDVLDEPAVVEREWKAAGNEEAIDDFYDLVLVYGDQHVYDLARSYSFPDAISRRLRYTGYLDQRERLRFTSEELLQVADTLELGSDRLAVCAVGGGQDGSRLAEAFAQTDLPDGMMGVLLTGPYLPEQSRRRLRSYAANRPKLRVVDFLPEPAPLLMLADRIVSMGGYNSVLEALSFEKPTLVVPRVTPRREQILRAQRMKDLGLLHLLHPDSLTPSSLADWLRTDHCLPQVRKTIDLNGLSRMAQLLEPYRAVPYLQRKAL
ncbi:MAG TPA: glycosyltransferase [Acidobacteriota bacterium]|nr:glycosyltransferase [Acidobacteriota bacterium]